ncbi:MAG: ubiquinone/menaquinone biosynthesis methyltransferase [Candidatus Dadabacteria bacterium]|nr:ubiquinone/menaquinone biosynthesis methyltransferase [Candidatus Dadabacteria bacterium]
MPETEPLFTKLAGNYDRLNSICSLGIDASWRKRLAAEIGQCQRVLDVATGTAEVCIEVARKWPDAKITGIDPSSHMIRIAEEKTRKLGLEGRIDLVEGSAENLPFEDGLFDAVTIAFGIRNTVDPLLSLREMARVLRPSGSIGVLEFAVPSNSLFSPIYMFYMRNVIPLLGSIFGCRPEYRYLAESIPSFPQRTEFAELMRDAGFEPPRWFELTLGIVVLYSGVKAS